MKLSIVSASSAIVAQTYIVFAVVVSIVIMATATMVYAANEEPSIASTSLEKQSSSDQIVITLGTDGFLPKMVTIARGTTVLFKTTTGRYFWPASNEHPEHTVYADFDPKQPVKQDDTWSFRFDNVGTWSFHDHISPFFTGTIEVVEGGQKVEANKKEKITISQLVKDFFSNMNTFITQKLIYVNYSACQRASFTRDERTECWMKIVVPVIQRKGLKKALAFVDHRMKKDEHFAADCHIYMHRIGEEYYWQFFKHRRVEVSDKFDLCEMGFFHGFMQEFTSHGQDIVQAKRYCDLVTSQMKDRDKKPELLQQCYHGIGHGLVYMYAPQFWGQEDVVIGKSIGDCRKITDEIDECITGVFGGFAAMHWGLHGFHLPMSPDDPFRICHNQPKSYALGCYNMYVPVLYGVFGSNLVNAGHMIEKIQDKDIAKIAMEHLGAMPSYALIPKTNDYTSILKQCRVFRSPFNSWCLYGFSGSLMRIGGYEMATDRGTDFCMSPEMTQQERTTCFEAIIGDRMFRGAEDKREQYCQRVVKQYDIDPCRKGSNPS